MVSDWGGIPTFDVLCVDSDQIRGLTSRGGYRFHGATALEHSRTRRHVRVQESPAAAAQSYYDNQTPVDVGYCDHYVGVWYGLAHSGFDDAISHWNAIPATQKLPGWQPGALAFWSGGDHGHVAIGNHAGKVYSTDFPTSGRVGEAEVNDISSAWGKTFLGWTLPYFPGGADATVV